MSAHGQAQWSHTASRLGEGPVNEDFVYLRPCPSRPWKADSGHVADTSPLQPLTTAGSSDGAMASLAVALDWMQNERMAISTRIAERFAEQYVRNELRLTKELHLMRLDPRGLPVYVDLATL